MEHEHPQFPEEQRRHTSSARNDSADSLFALYCSEPKSCFYVSPLLILIAEVSCLILPFRACYVSQQKYHGNLKS